MTEAETRANHLCVCGEEKGVGKLKCWSCWNNGGENEKD